MTTFVAQAVIFYMIFFLGVIGNSIVLFVLLRQKSRWSITATYLFNLAIADTMFVCILPFWGHYHLTEFGWRFGTAMCKAAGAMTLINMYASIFFLTAISADRWMAIVRATRMSQRRNTVATRWICGAIWFVSLLLCLPSILYRTVTLRPTDIYDNCTQAENVTPAPGLSTPQPPPSVLVCIFFVPASNVTSKAHIMGGIELLQSFLGFILPLCIISFCYARIVWTVKQKVINKRVRKDKVATLAAFIIAAFIFCWTPFHIMNLYSALGGWLRLFLPDRCFFQSVKPFTVCLAYANSCINPIVYAFTTTKFQDNMREICSADKSPRPYRMVISNPNDEKQSKNPVHALTFRRNNTAKELPRRNNEPPQEMENLESAEKSQSAQSFSYYSCPPVMQGLANFQPCKLPSDVAYYNSHPENGECSQCLAKEEQM